MVDVQCIALLAVFCPLVSALLVGLNTERINIRLAQVITCGLMMASCLAAWVLFEHVAIKGSKVHLFLLQWIEMKSLIANWAISIDVLSSVMMITVTTVSALVHIYSIGYMAHDQHIPRFMAYLSLFTFFMLMLVVSDNFIQLFFGWEGVGLSSYLLIGFWFKKDSANAAAMKAFLVNRVGDIGLAVGIFLIFYVFDSVEFATVFAKAASFSEDTIHIFGEDVSVISAICLLLFIGCMGKSAQLGLHTWLPDAMEGPTPVSALIHAATMVTAGVFMLARCSPLFEYSPVALQVVTLIGMATCLFAASVALTQTDIKKIIAYSTCSQLGYMVFACGVSAYAAAIFHLVTHAFFKALLFLGAGSVIHALDGEQDISKMGGIARKIKCTYLMMWIGSLAIAGIYPFAGFYSKDAILEAARLSGDSFGLAAYGVGLLVAMLTAFYSWRLLFLVFHGDSKVKEDVHVHESPVVMLLPLMVLSIGAVLSGWYGADVLGVLTNHDFWHGSIKVVGNNSNESFHAHSLISELPMVAGVIGIGLAYWFYSKRKANNYPNRIISSYPKVYALLKDKWYFDEVYAVMIVQNVKNLGVLAYNYIDTKVIDSIPNGAAAMTLGFSKVVSKIQSGYLYNYIIIMIISALLILIMALNGLQLI